MRIEKVSIKWRIFAYFMVFSVIMLVLLWLFQVVFLDSFYKSSKIREIDSCSKTLTANADNDELQSLVESMAQQYDMCIRIVTEEGQNIAQADVLPGCVIHKLPGEEVRRLCLLTKVSGGQYISRFSMSAFSNTRYQRDHFLGNPPPADEGMPETIVYTMSTEVQGTPAMIMLNTTLSPVTATVKTLRRQLIWITLIMVFVALVLAWIIGRRVYRPMMSINKAAEGLSRGEYRLDLKDGAYREINELNDTLNRVAVELGKVERLRGELIANVSHDLRTPLTMITAYAEGMRDLPGENTPENVQVIIDEAERLSALVNDVLDLGKLQSGTQEIMLRRFDLTGSIEEVLKRYRKFTEQKGFVIGFDGAGPVTVTADEGKIQQVLYNLINNAITYTGEDQTVLIRETVADGAVTVSVIDSGGGIPEEDLAHIWDRYYQSSQTHRRAEIGTGLGLSIVRSIITLHHGQYGVESGEKGTTFWFSLPVEEA